MVIRYAALCNTFVNWYYGAFEIRASDFGDLRLETMHAINRWTLEIGWLGHTPHHSCRDHPAPDDPHPARIRARSDFSSRQITRRERAGADFPHPDRRSNGANGFTRRDHQRRTPGSDDA